MNVDLFEDDVVQKLVYRRDSPHPEKRCPATP